ncbi:MAG TPA: hypothetical protein VLE21_00995 [Candidatus Nitrosocosmicus sp.]|nr:hypothetical protein [Candidatus Nitrosocosmicus sp.]
MNKIKADSTLSDIQKIKRFYDLMKDLNVEPIVLRLSGYMKQKSVKIDYLLTFTPSRIILIRKNFIRKLTDPGFVAGLGPYLYYVLSKKIEYSDIKKKDSSISKDDLRSSSDQTSILYKNITKFVFYPDVKTLISNMLGTAIKENVLIIHTNEEKYEFILPTGKNGDYDKTLYWLKMCLPVKISQK